MRLKLEIEGDIYKDTGKRKIVFPVDLNIVNKVKDLKREIEMFIGREIDANSDLNKRDFKIEMRLDGFMLVDEFKVDKVLRNDDVIR